MYSYSSNQTKKPIHPTKQVRSSYPEINGCSYYIQLWPRIKHVEGFLPSPSTPCYSWVTHSPYFFVCSVLLLPPMPVRRLTLPLVRVPPLLPSTVTHCPVDENQAPTPFVFSHWFLGLNEDLGYGPHVHECVATNS